MAFTYDPANLKTSVLDRLRLELGDTEQGNGVKPNGGNLQNEELQVLIDEAGGDFYTAAAKACRLLATHWARFADVSAGKVREAASQVSARYVERAREYERQAVTGGASSFAGGVAGSVYAGIVNDDDDAQSMTSTGGEYA